MKLDRSKGCGEYQALSRRQFIGDSAKVSLLAAIAPSWLPKVSYAKDYVANRDVIVSVYLRGGCDGLTMCVPHGDSDYYANRPNLAVPRPDSGSPDAAVNLDGFFGLPQPMAPLLESYQNGDLAVVHAAGNIDPNRSHFDAQRHMEVGKANDPTLYTGWLGRHLMSAPPMEADAPLRGVGIAFGLPRTLVGGPQTLPIPNLDTFGVTGYTSTATPRLKVVSELYTTDEIGLTDVAADTLQTITLLEQINFSGYVPAGGAVYPAGAFGTAVRSTAALIRAEVGVEAVHIDLGGWDTHANQGVFFGTMFNLMTNLAGAISAFHKDVFTGYPGKVVVVVVSEFGRVLKENASFGTDHGYGNVMFVVGQGVRGGQVYGQWPGLQVSQLHSGRYLKVTTDYRHVVAEVIEKRLGNTNMGFVFPDFSPNFIGICD